MASKQFIDDPPKLQMLHPATYFGPQLEGEVLRASHNLQAFDCSLQLLHNHGLTTVGMYSCTYQLCVVVAQYCHLNS